MLIVGKLIISTIRAMAFFVSNRVAEYRKIRTNFVLVDFFSRHQVEICYRETMNLDGEINLKVKRYLETTFSNDHRGFKDLYEIIRRQKKERVQEDQEGEWGERGSRRLSERK